MLFTTIVFLVPEQHQSFPNVPVDFIQKQVGKGIHGVVISPSLYFRIEFLHHLVHCPEQPVSRLSDFLYLLPHLLHGFLRGIASQDIAFYSFDLLWDFSVMHP